MGVRAVVVVAVLCALAPGASLASPKLQPGVHVDSGSPAGKQYSIPIDSARSQTGGGHGAAGSGAGGNPPAFGTGVVAAKPVVAPKPVAATPTPAGRSRSRASSVEHATPRRTSRAARRKVPASARLTQPIVRPTDRAAALAQASVGSNAWVALVGGGALVLVLGGVGGLLIRRLRW